MTTKRTETPSRGVPITLDRPRTLRYPISAVRRILSEKGPEYLEGEGGEDELERLCYLAYQGLLHEDADLTPEAVGDLVDFSQVEELTRCVLLALGQDLPKQEPAPDRPTKRGRVRPGKK